MTGDVIGQSGQLELDIGTLHVAHLPDDLRPPIGHGGVAVLLKLQTLQPITSRSPAGLASVHVPHTSTVTLPSRQNA